MNTNCFTVSWSGSDDPGGSGIASYNYASRDGGPFKLRLAGVTNTSALIQGERGVHHAFYSWSQDQVGNMEALPSGAQAETVTGFHLTRAALDTNAPSGLVLYWESATDKLYEYGSRRTLGKALRCRWPPTYQVRRRSTFSPTRCPRTVRCFCG